MPLAADTIIPSPETAVLTHTAGDGHEPVVVNTPADQRVEELERTNKKLEARVYDLETALAEARKIIRDRENLLTEVQFKPKVCVLSSIIFVWSFLTFLRTTSMHGRIPESLTNKSRTRWRSACKPSSIK